MKRIATLAYPCLVLGCLVLGGCSDNLSPLSPKLQQELNNQNAKINGIENNQNAIKLELGRISNELGIQNSNVQEMQQGWLNVQGQLSRNENSGVQILQGDGPLFLVFAVITLGMLLYYFYRAEKYRKTATFFARQIRMADPGVQERVLTAAWKTDVEREVFNMTSNVK